MSYLNDFLIFYGLKDPVAEAQSHALQADDLERLAFKARRTGNKRLLDKVTQMQSQLPRGTEAPPILSAPAQRPGLSDVPAEIQRRRSALNDALIPRPQ